MPSKRRTPLSAFLLLAALGAFGADAQTPGPTQAAPLDVIVVTATRVAEPSFDLPVSIDSVDRSAIADGQLQVNLSESLDRVPGLLVQNRQNYAQDLQISSRGFGSDATFGVIGMRIYVDGIPATQPDGQGQVSNIDLGSAERVEVLRGPFSALYGNSAGGVISVFTQDGKPGTALDVTGEFGSYDVARGAAKLSGDDNGLNYVADAAWFHTGGYRYHSAAGRGNINAKLRYTLDDESDLTFVANAVAVNAADPLGQTRKQFDTDVRQAGINAILYNTRKSVDQEQFGVTYRRDFGDHDSLTAIGYGGNRAVTQFQAIPTYTEKSPASPGGVIDLAVGYAGTDAHLTDDREIAGAKLQTTIGLAYDGLSEGRTGYQNFVGPMLGVQGALRRDETDDVDNFDQYIQAELRPDAHWLIEAGLRNSRVAFTSRDHYIVPGNGDDSGGATYYATTPVFGVTYGLTPSVNLYAAYGKGFQTPTLDQLAYRSTSGTQTGLNFGLSPSRSDDYEIGVKSFLGDWGRLTAAAFHIDTRDDLAIEANAAGRSVYQNVGRTHRDGVELGFQGQITDGIGAVIAYTYVRAAYADSFSTCPATPCVLTTIPAGNRLPGVPLHSVYAELSWRDDEHGLLAALEGRAESRIFVNDGNSDAAPFYAIANLRTGFEQDLDSVTLKEFEPAPGRSAYVGMSVHY
jgi:iron complex outermembrane receptor protein